MLFGAWALISCETPLNTEREFRPQLTVGEELYKELCERVASAENPADLSGAQTRSTCLYGYPPSIEAPRFTALHQNRRRLIKALDFVLKEPVGSQLSALLTAMTPLYDSGEPQAQTAALAVLMKSLEESPDAVGALTSLGGRGGYRPAAFAAGLAAPLANYDRIDDLMWALGALVGPGGAGETSWIEMLGGAEKELQSWKVEDPLVSRTALEDLQRLLLTTDADYSEEEELERFVVRRDSRGLALPRVLETGSWDPRFVDRDGDGAADINLAGHFVDESGFPSGIGRPFKVAGESGTIRRDFADRLLNGSGELVYEYLDTSKTLSAALLAESRTLLEAGDTGNLFELLRPIRHLLGPDRFESYTFPDHEVVMFTGFDLSASPLLDGLHLLEYFGDTPSFPYGLGMAEALLVEHEGPLADVVATLEEMAEWADEPGYEDLDEINTGAFADEMMAVLVEMAQAPGLVEGLLEVADSEEVSPLGFYFGTFMTYRDVLTLDPRDPNAPPSFRYSDPVDRGQPDVGDNQSIFQRFLHLIHDTKGARVCNREGAFMEVAGITYPLWGPGYGECELFEIEDMSVFYLKSILGEAEMEFKDPVVNLLSNLDTMLEAMSGIIGFTKTPTYQAVNRFVFGQRNEFLTNIIDPPLATDGVSLEERHAGTIFAWEEPAFIEAMKPVLREFSKSARYDLFISMVSAMHLHWGSKQNEATQSFSPDLPGFSHQSGMVAAEDLMARGMLDAKLLRVGQRFLTAAKEVEVKGMLGAEILIELARQWTLPSWNRGLRGRRGERSTLRYDGVTMVTDLAPIWLLLELGRKLDEAFEGNGAARSGLAEIMGKLRSQFLQVEVEEQGEHFEFINRRGYAVAKGVLGFMGERFASARAETGNGWTHGLTERGEALFEHPVMAQGVRLLGLAVENPELRSELERVVDYLVDEQSANAAYFTTVYSLVDGIQRMVWSDSDVPLLRALAPAFTPKTGVVPVAVDLGAKVHRLDKSRALSRVLERLLEPLPLSGERPIEVLADVFAEVNRVKPGAEGAWNHDDTRQILRTVEEFLLDESRGMKRMSQLLENR